MPNPSLQGCIYGVFWNKYPAATATYRSLNSYGQNKVTYQSQGADDPDKAITLIDLSRGNYGSLVDPTGVKTGSPGIVVGQTFIRVSRMDSQALHIEIFELPNNDDVVPVGLWNAEIDYGQGNREEIDSSKLISGGRIHVSPSRASNSNYSTVFSHDSNFNVSGEDFILEARIKNPTSEGGISCYDPKLTATDATGAQAYVRFMAQGCTRYAAIRAGNTYRSGSTSDLSRLGQNFDDWVTIKLKVSNKRIFAYYNNTKLYSIPYYGTIGDITNITQSFKGSGSIDWIRLYRGDGTFVYGEEFGGATTE